MNGVARTRRRWTHSLRGAAAVIAGLAFVAIRAGGASGAGSDTATLRATAQAWYLTATPCVAAAVPGGCPTVNPYPVGTLHVAVSGGQATAVSALLFDTRSLSAGSAIDSATLTLTVDPNPTDGGANAAAAALGVCAMAAPFSPADGSAQPAPPCAGPPVLLRVDPTGATYRADVTDMVAGWAAGQVNNGLRIQPGAATPTDAWHVVLDGRTSPAGAPAIDVSFRASTLPPTGAGETQPPASTSSLGVAVTGTVPAVPGAVPALNANAGAQALADPAGRRLAPSVIAAPAATPAALTKPPIVGSGRYAYPAVFFLPPLLIIAVIAIGRVLTQEMVLPYRSDICRPR